MDALVIIIATIAACTFIATSIVAQAPSTDGTRTTLAITGPCFLLAAMAGAAVLGVLL